MAGLFIDRHLASREPLLFSWTTLPGAHQADTYARSSLGGVMVDMQHGLIGYSGMLAMVQAVHRAGKPAFVRPPLNDFGMVSRALDLGVAAIVMPMINSADDALKLVSAAKYAPIGERSWGPHAALNASGLSGDDYLQRANQLTKVFGMIETADALERVGEICAVDGLDGVFVGPNDLSISLSGGAVVDTAHHGVTKALPKIVAAADASGVVPGIYASNAEQVVQYQELGFRFISVASDLSILGAGLAACLPSSTQAI
ncbi:MAG: HpcH/HpaI aldolase family protein [Aestuariivirgaceae bacterium]